MNASSKDLLDVVDDLDEAVRFLNAASMAIVVLDEVQRGALSAVINRVVDIVDASRDLVAEICGIDIDEPKVSSCPQN